MSQSLSTISSFIWKHKKKFIFVPIVVLSLFVVNTSIRVVAQVASGEVRSCISPAGLVRIVDESTNCKPGETLLTWNIQGPTGPTGPTGPQGPQGPAATVQRLQGLGGTLDPISPAGTWIDVPNASVTQTFSGGKWKVAYSGVLTMSGGNGTAYARVQVRPTGGTAFDVGQITLYRFQSTLPNTEKSTEQFLVQGLFDMPTGEVTIVPQIYGPSDWSLAGSSVMILEQ